MWLQQGKRRIFCTEYLLKAKIQTLYTHHHFASFHKSHFTLGKKKSKFNANNKLKKPSQKSLNVIKLQYDPRVDSVPRKQEFIQKMKENERDYIQRLIKEFEQITLKNKVLHTELMSNILNSLRKFANMDSSVPIIEKKKKNNNNSFIDSFSYMFSKDSIISDESFLLSLQNTLQQHGFIVLNEKEPNEILEETKRYLQAFIDPSFLISAVNDISQKAINHFSNIVSLVLINY